MTYPSNILILSGSFGEGHRQAAQALLEASRAHEPAVEAAVADILEVTHPRLHSLGKQMYLNGIRAFPGVYEYLYERTKQSNSIAMWVRLLRLLPLNRLTRLLEERRPQIVVSTFPVAAAAVSMLKSQREWPFSAVTVITDHTDHSFWVHPHTNHYMVGSEPVKRRLERHGVSSDHISVTGIPVRKQFYETFNKQSLMAKHRLDPNRRTVLVMGGGYGIVHKGLADLLLGAASRFDLQVIVVCGHNRRLKERLELQLQGDRFRVTGFVEPVSELMAIADLLITKPGGISTSEAVAVGLPMILYNPLPGPEQENAVYLKNEGVAWEAETEQQLAEQLELLIARPSLLREMSERAWRIRKQQTSELALQTMLHAHAAYGLFPNVFSAKHNAVP